MDGHGNDDLERAYRRLADELAERLVSALGPFVTRVVRERAPHLDLERPAAAAGHEAVVALGPRLRAALSADVDERRVNPMQIVREVVAWPTEVLAEADVEPAPRDRFEAERFPDDVYALTPASFSDLDPELTDLGLAWGAATAALHRQRHRDR